jgi:hypothetical protein
VIEMAAEPNKKERNENAEMANYEQRVKTV